MSDFAKNKSSGKNNIPFFDRKYNRYLIAAMLVLLAGCLACALLCTGIRTENSASRELSVICVAVFTACLCVFILMNLATKEDRKQPWWIMKHNGSKGGFSWRLPYYLLFALLAALFWEWIFILVSDCPAGKKVVVYAEVPSIEDDALSVKLEEELPDSIRRIYVHSFDYAMFDSDSLLNADLYIIPEASYETYGDSFGAIGGDFVSAHSELTYFSADGEIKGILLSGDNSSGALSEYISYGTGNYYLFFNANSLHTRELNGSADNAAVETALKLISLP